MPSRHESGEGAVDGRAPSLLCQARPRQYDVCPWLLFAAALRVSQAMSIPQVIDVPERERFELSVDGTVVGFVAYRRSPGVIAFTHTEVDPGHEGEGLGSILVSGALGAARAQGSSVLPFCPFVRQFIASHREYLDLVPETRRGAFGLDDG
jgi:uncharacterized protein